MTMFDSHTCQVPDNGLLLCVQPAINGSNIMQQEPDFLIFHFLSKYVSLYSHSHVIIGRKNRLLIVDIIEWQFFYCSLASVGIRNVHIGQLRGRSHFSSCFISTKKWKAIFIISSKLNVFSFQSQNHKYFPVHSHLVLKFMLKFSNSQFVEARKLKQWSYKIGFKSACQLLPCRGDSVLHNIAGQGINETTLAL